MPWIKGERIPTNLIVGFLGSGKTTAIANLLSQRPVDQNWSIFVNEFGKVSIDQALMDSSTNGVAVEKLGGGCACCTMSFAFKPLLAQFIRRSKPDRLILEPSGVSHPAKVVDILRSPDFAGAIDLRNIICLMDPTDIDHPERQMLEVFQDQVQLADIVVINWTDLRDRKLIDRCRAWVESFEPPKQLIVETSFGAIDPELLDENFKTVRLPLFSGAHPLPEPKTNELNVLSELPIKDDSAEHFKADFPLEKPEPGQPVCFQNNGPDFQAWGWIFHVDGVFDRKKLIAFLSELSSIARLKGVFRCEGDWWKINRAKDATDFSKSTYRRDSRLEIILDGDPWDWGAFEVKLLQCMVAGKS